MFHVHSLGSTNCAHGDKHTRKEVFAYTNLGAHKLIKTFLTCTLDVT